MKKEITYYVETQKTMKFLMGLNDSYSIVRNNTRLLDPLPTVNKAYSFVLHHERQAKVSSGKNTFHPEAAVFAVKNVGRATEYEDSSLCCAKCNKMNHNSKNYVNCSGGLGHMSTSK